MVWEAGTKSEVAAVAGAEALIVLTGLLRYENVLQFRAFIKQYWKRETLEAHTTTQIRI